MSPSTPIDLFRDPDANTCSQGLHLFKITAFDEIQGNGDYPSWQYKLVCQDAGKEQGKSMLLFLSLNPNARFKIEEFLNAVEAPNKHAQITGDAFVGSTLQGLCMDDNWDGNVRRKVTNFYPKNFTIDKLPRKVAEKLAASKVAAARRLTDAPKDTSASLPSMNGAPAQSTLPKDSIKSTKAPF